MAVKGLREKIVFEEICVEYIFADDDPKMPYFAELIKEV